MFHGRLLLTRWSLAFWNELDHPRAAFNCFMTFLQTLEPLVPLKIRWKTTRQKVSLNELVCKVNFIFSCIGLKPDRLWYPVFYCCRPIARCVGVILYCIYYGVTVGRLKTRDLTSRDHRNCGGWHCETGQLGTISQGWTSRDLFRCASRSSIQVNICCREYYISCASVVCV